jgi:hypothetical protein
MNRKINGFFCILLVIFFFNSSYLKADAQDAVFFIGNWVQEKNPHENSNPGIYQFLENGIYIFNSIFGFKLEGTWKVERNIIKITFNFDRDAQLTFYFDEIGERRLRLSEFEGRSGVVSGLTLIKNDGTTEEYCNQPSIQEILSEEENEIIQINEQLSKNDINTLKKSGWPYLLEAVEKPKYNVIRHLLAKGADPNATTKYGVSVLHKLAARKEFMIERIFIVNLLLSKKVTINPVFVSENSPLDTAISNNNYNMAKYFVRKGADVNFKEKDGYTILFEACGKVIYDLELITLLIKKGANVKAKRNDGTSILDWAREHGNEPVIELLIKSGAK